MNIRKPAVAGLFYPDERESLARDVAGYIEAATTRTPVPKAIIAPHAGYIYSGPVAGSAYRAIGPLRDTVNRVVLLGPSHRVGFKGLATPSADGFDTPLGRVPVDRDVLDQLLSLPQVQLLDAAHAQEHSLEVHLPFLQIVLGTFRLIPLVVGDASAESVAEVLEQVWGGDETLIVISSDLSHYLDYQSATERDARTSSAIEQLRFQDIGYDDACGRNPVGGLLLAASRHHLQCHPVDLRNSGDTTGSRDRVVGYGAYIFH